MEEADAPPPAEETPGALDYPDRAQRSEHQSRPVVECGSSLAREDGPEGPGDGERTGEVAFGRGECVRGAGGFEEE